MIDSSSRVQITTFNNNLCAKNESNDLQLARHPLSFQVTLSKADRHDVRATSRENRYKQGRGHVSVTEDARLSQSNGRPSQDRNVSENRSPVVTLPASMVGDGVGGGFDVDVAASWWLSKKQATKGEEGVREINNGACPSGPGADKPFPRRNYLRPAQQAPSHVHQAGTDGKGTSNEPIADTAKLKDWLPLITASCCPAALKATTAGRAAKRALHLTQKSRTTGGTPA